MIKKLLILGLAVAGFVYSSQATDLFDHAMNASNENARTITAASNDGWGANSGY